MSTLRRRLLTGAAVATAGAAVALAAIYTLRSGADGEVPAAAGPTGTAPALGPLEDFHPEDGGRAPDFALIDVRDGVTVRRLSDYRGKTIVLNWYASWCPPCRQELPEFQRVHEMLGGEVVFLILNLQESRGAARGMLDDFGITFPALLDSDAAVARHYRIPGMPTTFFIDSEGRVSISGSGVVTPEALRRELGKLGHSY
ncbi:MAG: TlpA family protein disulfide reductase [Tepidiformaceae bacterium]